MRLHVISRLLTFLRSFIFINYRLRLYAYFEEGNNGVDLGGMWARASAVPEGNDFT